MLRLWSYRSHVLSLLIVQIPQVEMAHSVWLQRRLIFSTIFDGFELHIQIIVWSYATACCYHYFVCKSKKKSRRRTQYKMLEQLSIVSR